MGGSERILKMRRLWDRVQTCTLCDREHVTKYVFGDGSVHARVMLVGEGPGEEEDASGHPFVGEAGQLLTDILNMAGFPRREELFIANTVKCRRTSLKGVKLKNKKPSDGELARCSVFLQSQLEIVRPKVVVGLGGTAIAALKGLRSKDVKSTKMAGLTEKGKNCWYVWTHHPSYPIYRGRDLALIEAMVKHIKKAKEMSRG
jgi:DNA polymerase